MGKQCFFAFSMLLYLCMSGSFPMVYLFPMDDCRTSDIDLLIAFESFSDDYCPNQEADRKFITDVVDVFLAPDEESLTRLRVAVATFTADGPVMHLPFQNSSRQDFVEKLNDIEPCHWPEFPKTDDFSMMENVISSINISFTEAQGSRELAKPIVVMIRTEIPNFLFDSEYLYCLQEQDQSNCVTSVFFITENHVSADDSIFMLENSIFVRSRELLSNSHHFSKAICSQCKKGWFNFETVEKDLSHFYCYYLHKHDSFINWDNAAIQCQNEHSSTVAAVKTKEELALITSELFYKLQPFQVDSHDSLTIRNDIFIYVYIDIFQSQFDPQHPFPNETEHELNVQNWISNEKSRKCGAWLYKYPANLLVGGRNGKLNSDINSSNYKDKLTQGWVDIPCGQPFSKFTLCKLITQTSLWDSFYTEILPANERSQLEAAKRGEYVKYENGIVSVAAIAEKKWFAQHPQLDVYSNFPTFVCDVDNGEQETANPYIPYSYVCDYKDDCLNGRDEEICQYRVCETSEFQCLTSSRCIPFDAVCDLFWDCEDGSDEQSCLHTCVGHLCCPGKCIPRHLIGDGYPDCEEYCDGSCADKDDDESISAVSTLNQMEKCVFICNRTECVYPSQLKDGVVDCQGPEGPLDETIGALEHVSECDTPNVYLTNVTDWAPRCVYVKDRYGKMLGCPDGEHLQNCPSFVCPEGYVKCYESYCIPIHYVNNGLRDCPLGDDENTESINCVGHFRCPTWNKCLHPDLVCDGHPDCSVNGEDEFNCNVSCAAGFRCIAGTVSVGTYDENTPLRSLEFIDSRTRYLDLSGVNISHAVTNERAPQLRNLVYVSFVQCNISNVGNGFADAFGSVTSIYWMNLSYNLINEIPTNSVFRSTTNLRVLDLSHNKELTMLQARAFEGSNKLEELNLSYTGLRNLFDSAFDGLQRLQLLNLSHTLIDSLLDKNFPSSLLIHTLDLRGTNIRHFGPDAFDGLRIQSELHTDVFSLCCSEVRGAAIPEHTCKAPADSVSSCTDLIDNQVQKVLLWLVGIIALLGNAVVIIYRIIWEKDVLKKAYGVFITNLGVSDFLMGVYLIIIAGADVVYRDNYVWNDRKWRYSATCKVAGFLSTLSSETSMFFIFLVTLDRFLIIKFPFGDYRISKRVTFSLTFLSWIIGSVLSLIQLLPIFDVSNIYTSNALCLGLPLTTERPDGWEFSMAVFVVLNFTMFLIIAIGQFMIYRAMASHRSDLVQGNSRRAQDIMVAKQLSMVVLSDFLCWFPIGVMGLLAFSGKEVGREAYAWSAVLVLPVNSALNPLLYTIPVILSKWEDFKQGRRTTSSTRTTSTKST